MSIGGRCPLPELLLCASDCGLDRGIHRTLLRGRRVAARDGLAGWPDVRTIPATRIHRNPAEHTVRTLNRLAFRSGCPRRNAERSAIERPPLGERGCECRGDGRRWRRWRNGRRRRYRTDEHAGDRIPEPLPDPIEERRERPRRRIRAEWRECRPDQDNHRAHDDRRTPHMNGLLHTTTVYTIGAVPLDVRACA